YNLGDKDHGISKEELIEISKNTKEYISLPLYLYDHSGITMNTNGFNDRWDSGQVGIIFVSKSKVKEEYGWGIINKDRLSKIIEILDSEVKLYDTYIRGDIFCYSIINNLGEDIDSCCGFYGCDFDNNGLMENAKNTIDYHIRKEERNGIQMELELF
ncbi:MAG: hypothetical protein M0Q13_12920, partial [Methanothrix sp.]|nr:hypothetical protein [Methanothrix sp.]